jgi:XTP/dITP diphosphohydrolase
MIMPSIVFATANPHKVREVKEMLQGKFQIASLKDIGCEEDVPETSPTIEGNALQKARYVSQHYQVDCFSEDTGLEIEALNGEPGVFSARYAGPARDAEANMNLVLEKLKGKSNRNARFKTVIALILNGEEHLFEGIVEGVILKEKRGNDGFGYDPIFQPLGYHSSFGEMPSAEKNKISHRARALEKLVAFLQNT